MSNQKLNQLVDQSERIGVIGSPSSTTELALDILASAVNKKLVGELALFRYMQDGFDHYALGQITEIALRNIWHEDPTMRSLIRQRGNVDAVSERQDTHQGEMIVSAVFLDQEGKYSNSSLGTVPATGTSIQLVEDRVIDELLKQHKQQVFYLGRVYSSKPKLPLWFPHFDTSPGGIGDTYHTGIFGKTGSGKSVLAKMIVLAYARHPQMGLFILDPQGEFANGLRENSPITSMGQTLSRNSLNELGRSFEVFDLSRFRLDTWELFGELLAEFGFFRELGIRSGPYQTEAANSLVDFLRINSDHKLETLDDSAFLDSLTHLHDNIGRIYAQSAGQERVRNFISDAREGLDEGYGNPPKDKWDQTLEFFSRKNNKVSIWSIISRALNQQGSRPLVVVDLSKKPDDIPESTWNEEIKPLLIDSFLSALVRQSEESYDDNRSLNTLVVLDEAHRLAPRGSIDSDRRARIRTRLIDAAKTTRKYGLGWMFISQTLSSLDRDIIDSGLRLYFFGFGLAMGTEFQSLRELVGGRSKTLDLYQLFRDPLSSFDASSREYSFMAVGPVSPLSSSGSPLFFSAFTNPDEFLTANQLSIQSRMVV